MLPIVNTAQRETVPASELMLALQCGGSDGYSGITANPALGIAADILVRHGGTAILSRDAGNLWRRASADAPGADAARSARSSSTSSIGGRTTRSRNNMEMNNNPSPGNKLGGLTTILEKSLGAAAKGGTTPLNAVYQYADPVTEKGFVFMDTPGYDPVSATGQVAGGANILCFTTGRGSAYGCKPTPSIKIATNSDMYRPDDRRHGHQWRRRGRRRLARGEGRRRSSTRSSRVASGEKTKSEVLGYGDNEFVPWQIGATV